MKNLIKSIFSKNKNYTKVDYAQTDDVKKYYENWTDRYMKSFGEIFQSKRANSNEELIEYFIKQMGVADEMKIMDAGCGVCGPAMMIAQKFNVKIDALTISDTQVKISKKRIKHENLQDRITVYQADFHDLSEFPNTSYDIIYFMESLVHSNQPNLVIEQVYNKLKPDGILYIKDLFEKTAYSKNELKDIQHWVEHNNKNIHLNISKKEDILYILREIGFQLEFCMLMRIPTNQDIGNRFVVENSIMPDPITNSLPPYLEWYEIKAIKPGPNIVYKM